MKKNNSIRSIVSVGILTCLVMATTSVATKAQSVIFPQAQQPGVAVIDDSQSNQWILKNDILSAKFVKQDGKLAFGGCEAMNLEAGTEPFEVKLGEGGTTVVKASQMALGSVEVKSLTGDKDAVKGSDRFNGKALEATYTYTFNTSQITVLWRAVLRDGSHYLRTEMEITTDKDVKFYELTPMNYTVNAKAAGSTPRVVGNTRGAVVVSDKIFAGLETPMGKNSAGQDWSELEGEVVQTINDSWTSASWTQLASDKVPARVVECGCSADKIYYLTKSVTFSQKGVVTTTFLYKSGSNRLNMCGVEILDGNGDVVASDYHKGYTGNAKENNEYHFTVPTSGTYTLRYLVEKSENLTSSGNITVTLTSIPEGQVSTDDLIDVKGVWSRNTTLKSTENWKVSSVIGIVAPGQQRRSFLAYSERERAVPWRAFPCYISWYELNINRNNAQAPNYTGNMTIEQCADVVNHWKSDFYDKYKIAPKAFVWDDGWDSYGTWTFNPNFPNGFSEVDVIAKQMNTGIGAWLGPVGGYGTSGNYRRQYWTDKGQSMVLSNPEYYSVFKAAAKNLTVDQGYDFRFFKFDGISAQFSATGPDSGTTGEENAEGIIRLERYVREELKEDIFFNTTVGTWASPFWYHFTDATWRQENDYGTIGNNSIDRENWITYRDRLVYQNYVQNSPLCPINTLMTHGFILSSFGSVSKNMDYDAVVREMRCAFACGSGMVELYNDYALMNSINGGALWKDLADCIKWQEANADVLPDAHWVGGNPWDGSKANVYGWASWNGKKATLALRNGSNDSQVFKTTLRAALDIPDYVNGTIVLKKAFDNQAALPGLSEWTQIDFDTELTLTLPASSVFVFNGKDGADAENDIVDGIYRIKNEYNGRGEIVYNSSYSSPCLNNITLGNYSKNNVAPTGNGAYWYVKNYNNKIYLFNIESEKLMVENNGTITFTDKVSDKCAFTYDIQESDSKIYYRIVSSEKYLSTSCGWEAGTNQVKFRTHEAASDYLSLIADEGYTLKAFSEKVKKADDMIANVVKITYNIKAGGKTVHSNEFVSSPGASYPTPELPSTSLCSSEYYEFEGIPTGTVSSSATIDITIKNKLPFEVSESFEQAKWHTLTIHTAKNYLNYEAGATSMSLTRTTTDYADKDLFCFVGNIVEGFAIYNKAAGSGYLLSSAKSTFDGNTGGNTFAIMTAESTAKSQAYLWDITKSSNISGGFYIGQHNNNNGNNRLNKRSGKLAYWNGGADAGSTFLANGVDIEVIKNRIDVLKGLTKIGATTEEGVTVIFPDEFKPYTPVQIDAAIDAIDGINTSTATYDQLRTIAGSYCSAAETYKSAITSYGSLSTVNYTLAEKYGTIMLPSNDSKPSGLTLYSCSSATDGVLNLKSVSNFVKNTPYIVSGTAGSKYQFIGYDKSSECAGGTATAGLLTGTLNAIDADGVNSLAAEGTNYVLMLQGGKLGFYQLDPATTYSNLTIGANRCYLTLPDQSDVKAFYFDLDDATGINGVGSGAFSQEQGNDSQGELGVRSVNLAGQAVGNDYKGIVIRNGKKILNK